MSGAVFLFDRDKDLNVFATQAQAEGWMEAIDVEDGEYLIAYRADGTCLVPAADGARVVLAQTGDVEPAVLRDRLRDYAARVSLAPRTTDPQSFAAQWLGPRPALGSCGGSRMNGRAVLRQRGHGDMG